MVLNFREAKAAIIFFDIPMEGEQWYPFHNKDWKTGTLKPILKQAKIAFRGEV